MDPITFVQAANYTRGRSVPVNLVVLHSMEAPLADGIAASVGRYFQNVNVQASCHYGHDPSATVQSVKESDTAWHTPGVNSRSIGMEHAGYARFTPEDWATPDAQAMLDRSAQLCADICKRYGIPPVYVDEAGIVAGRAGITMHRTVTYGLRTAGGHTDPGADFPIDAYVSKVAALLAPPVPAPTPKIDVKPITPVWTGDSTVYMTALVTVQPVGYGLGLAEYDFGKPLACLVGVVLNGPSPNDGDGWWNEDLDVDLRAQVRGTRAVVTGIRLKRPVQAYVTVQIA